MENARRVSHGISADGRSSRCRRPSLPSPAASTAARYRAAHSDSTGRLTWSRRSLFCRTALERLPRPTRRERSIASCWITSRRTYFGYDVTVEPLAVTNTYRLTFGPLTLSPALRQRFLGDDASRWTMLPASGFPDSRTVRARRSSSIEPDDQRCLGTDARRLRLRAGAAAQAPHVCE